MSENHEGKWPLIQYEKCIWHSSVQQEVPRRARKLHQGQYLAAIPLEISNRACNLPPETNALVAEAGAMIARFDAEIGFDIQPFSAVLLRSESAASSKIENLTASARAIAEAELGPTRNNASQIVANTRAMNAAVSLAQSINADSILEMHHALLSQSHPKIAGKWREEQVWVGGTDYGPHGASFVPPQHSRVQKSIEDLILFMDRDDIPVLAHIALAHAQFETIHPFPDGNGRTGRALIHAHLRNKALTKITTVPVSAGLLVDTGKYFDALTAYRIGDLVPIVEQLSHATFSAVANSRQLVEELRAVRSQWKERIVARKDSQSWKIVELLFQHPVINAALISHTFGIRGANTYRIIEPLIRAGVLVEFTDKKRNMMWRADDVLFALDEFAVRAGRRVRG